MKWPSELTLVRHDISEYNVLKQLKLENPAYIRFMESYEEDPHSFKTANLAKTAVDAIGLGVTDQNTRLANAGANALVVGQNLGAEIALPDVIFVSPYKRTRCTLAKMIEGWPELAGVPVYEEERIREQEHGIATLYNDTKIFQVLHPEQGQFMELHGDMSRYWYRYPQGENVPDVRDRVHSWLGTLIRDWDGRKVLAISHHLTILSFRATMERLSAEEFIRLDEEEKPINCGVTIYRGDPTAGKSGDGKLILSAYNKRLY